MGKENRKWALAALLAMSAGMGCAADTSEEDPELNAERQAVVDTSNGLKSINGLTAINGLKTVNGLSTVNGLKTVNGLMTINGLKTINGLATINGLPVDCSGKTAGVDCAGTPDGLLSASTGLLKSDADIMTASYLVRCALPKTSTVRVKDYTGGMVTLTGEIGLAPEWETGQCAAACQEKVSACLMALTNTQGNHVQVELSNQGTLGAGHSSSYKYQEAAFYGNVFLDPPAMNFAIGKDYEGLNILGLINVSAVANRVCALVNVATSIVFGTDACPYQPAGNANWDLTDPLGITSNRCTMKNGSASACRDKKMKTWNNPITTYRLDKGSQ